MPFFAIYETATGRLESLGTVVADDKTLAAKGLTKKQYPADPRTSTKQAASQWDEAAKDFASVAVSRTVKAGEFWSRFTQAERENIFDAAKNNAAVAKRLDAFVNFVRDAGADLNDASVIVILNQMEARNLIGTGRAAVIIDG